MRQAGLLLLVSMLIGWVGCRPLTAEEELYPWIMLEGVYSYVAFTEEGSKLVEGEFDVERTADRGSDQAPQLIGSWNNRAVVEQPKAGPQVGEGRLAATLRSNGDVVINLNPEAADQQVILVGERHSKAKSGDIFGRWHMETLSGPAQGGRFTLVHRYSRVGEKL